MTAASIRREAIEQAVAAGALQIGLRAAAIGAARGMRAVPRFRRLVIAQALTIGMAHDRRALRARRPVLAGLVITRGKCAAVGLGTPEDGMPVWGGASGGGDTALLSQ